MIGGILGRILGIRGNKTVVCVVFKEEFPRSLIVNSRISEQSCFSNLHMSSASLSPFRSLP